MAYNRAMTNSSAWPELRGVYAAAVTPLTPAAEPDLDALPALLDFLAQRGCHGALMLGTTGEGPSFSVAERAAIIGAALRHRARALPEFKILAGTGCANLADTIALTRSAFEQGADGAVVLPAFYYKGVSASGIADYYARLVAALPAHARVLIYHIPQVSGVGIPPESIERLRLSHPRQVWGMKDSQDDLAHTVSIAQRFAGFGVFVGSDSIMTGALKAGAVGSITALANVTAPLNRAVWEAHARGASAPEAQARLVRARQLMKGLNGPAAIKSALADLFDFPLWPVRAPLEMLPPAQRQALCEGLTELFEK